MHMFAGSLLSFKMLRVKKQKQKKHLWQPTICVRNNNNNIKNNKNKNDNNNN